MKAVKTEMGGEVFPGAEPGVELHEMHGLSRSFPPHFHDHYVIGLITGGRRRVHLRFPCGGEGEAGFSGVAEAGDFIMIHPFEIHACEDIGGSSLDWKSLRLSRESVLPILGRTEGSFPPILRDRKLRRLFELLCAAVKEGGNRERQRELLAAVLRGLPRKTNRCAGKRRNIPSPFPDILRWLAERSERPSLDAAARRFGVDKFVLLRCFSANFGITPYRCWESMRLERALDMLRRGHAPVDVAAELGFADQSHLTRAFRKVFGMPPGVFRRLKRARGIPGG